MEKRLITACLVLLFNSSLVAGEDCMLIDDFSSERSALGTGWQGFTDRVMGGISDIQAGYREVDSSTVLAMSGQVRLENNGGFIQVRLPLDARGGRYDASEFSGISVKARALKPGAYYLHLRTDHTRRPWAYYRARLTLSEDWTVVDIPWSLFEAQSINTPLDTTRLRSVAVVAYGEAFEAEVEVRRLSWLSDK